MLKHKNGGVNMKKSLSLILAGTLLLATAVTGSAKKLQAVMKKEKHLLHHKISTGM